MSIADRVGSPRPPAASGPGRGGPPRRRPAWAALLASLGLVGASAAAEATSWGRITCVQGGATTAADRAEGLGGRPFVRVFPADAPRYHRCVRRGACEAGDALERWEPDHPDCAPPAIVAQPGCERVAFLREHLAAPEAADPRSFCRARGFAGSVPVGPPDDRQAVCYLGQREACRRSAESAGWPTRR